jgi:thioredoxin reductase (NADPH)
MKNNLYDVIIIGSGPAGLTAAIYATRANLKTLVLAGEIWGGQPMTTTEVENFPGFPEGIQGPDLMVNIRKQAERFGAEIRNVNYTDGDLSKSPFKLTAGGETLEAKTVIIATGAKPKMLGIKGEKEKIGRGVSTCAVCDAGFFRNKKVVVLGGGDVAMEEAMELAEFASEVIVVHRRDEFRASKVMQDKVLKNPKIKTIMSTDVLEILGQERVSGIKVKDQKTGKTQDISFDGVFLAIGYEPSSEIFKQLERDERGYIVSDGVKTKIPGIFVAGDVMDKRYRQSVTAAAFGCQAALEVEKWLMSQTS